MTKRKFIINGQEITTVNEARGAMIIYNRKNPSNKIKSAREAKEFREIRDND